MTQKYLLLSILLTGCAGLITRDGTFPRRYSGTFTFQKDGRYFKATYENGFIKDELIAGREKYCTVKFNYKNGKQYGSQLYESANGNKVFSFVDSVKMDSNAADTSVDEKGNRWVSKRNFKLNNNSYEELQDKFHGTVQIYQTKDSIKNGDAFLLSSTGDTLCREQYLYGKRTKTDTSCQRSTENILSVIRKNTTNLRKIYNKYLKLSQFRAKIYIRYQISPNGEVGYIYADKLFCKNELFAKEVIQEMSTWKYKEVRPPIPDVVTVPFSFTE
jgi:hypothetical protein